MEILPKPDGCATGTFNLIRSRNLGGFADAAVCNEGEGSGYRPNNIMAGESSDFGGVGRREIRRARNESPDQVNDAGITGHLQRFDATAAQRINGDPSGRSNLYDFSAFRGGAEPQVPSSRHDFPQAFVADKASSGGQERIGRKAAERCPLVRLARCYPPIRSTDQFLHAALW